MRLLAPLLLLALAGCASTAPVSAYTVAPPEAVSAEAQRQEAIVRSGRSEPATASYTTRFGIAQRLNAVAERVLIAAAPYCGERVQPSYAISIGVQPGAGPVVLNSVGALRPGEEIVAADGQPIGRSQVGYDRLMNVAIARLNAGQPLTLSVSRKGRQVSHTYDIVPSCAYGVQLQTNGEWNAYADGTTLHVESELIRNIVNDDELAFVLAHELAHNLLGHIDKQKSNMMGGLLVGAGLDALLGTGGQMTQMGVEAGRMTYSQDYEREADYVGLYILDAAGYDLAAGPRLARRIAEQDPRSIYYASTHPSSSERAASLQLAVNEIEAKRRSGQPVVPTQVQRKS